MTSPPLQRPAPGWPELAVGLTVYVLMLITGIVWTSGIPDDQAPLRSFIGNAVNGFAGASGLLAAVALRLWDLHPFGFRRVSFKWLAVGATAGLVAFPLSFLIEHVYVSFITEANTQGDFEAAAQAGLGSLLILIFTAGILTPIGEEVLFRGVIASSLNRYGLFAGVVVSAAIFGIAHGLSVITLLAFVMGVITGLLLRRTGSLWPGIVTHIVYNSLHLVSYAFK